MRGTFLSLTLIAAVFWGASGCAHGSGVPQPWAAAPVVVDRAGNALYFSRSLIQYPRQDVPHRVFEHVGLYVYRRDFLLTLAGLAPTPLEQIESLEQLRVLEHGYKLRVVETRAPDHEFTGFSVDTAEDVERAEQMLRERGLT